MYEYGNKVPNEQLTAFANTLFSYLYFHLNMQNSFVNTSSHFHENIGKNVLCVERNTCMFNNDVINDCEDTFLKQTLAQKICNSYPNDDYFKKLYFLTAFILDLVLWWHSHLPPVNLRMGPNQWMRIFRNNFESTLEHNGGWQRFSEAGRVMLEFYKTHPYTDSFLSDYFLPDSPRAIMVAHGRLVHKFPEISTTELLKSFENLEMKTDGAAQNEESVEENQPELANKELNPFLLVKSLRKRRHDSPLNISDAEMDSEEVGDNPTAQVDKELKPFPIASGESKVRVKDPLEGTSESTHKGNQRKRRHGLAAKDSELGSESPKAKMDRK